MLHFLLNIKIHLLKFYFFGRQEVKNYNYLIYEKNIHDVSFWTSFDNWN